MGKIASGQREPHWLGARRNQQRVVRVAAAVCEFHLPVRRVDRGSAHAELQVDVLLLVELGRSKRYPVLGRAAREIVLGEIRPIVRRRFVRAQHRETTGVALPAKHFRSSVARRAAADDHHRSRHRRCRRRSRPTRILESFPDESLAVPLLDAPAGDRIERRCAQCLARAQAEARVVPRTAHRIGYEQALRRAGRRSACTRRRSRRARRRWCTRITGSPCAWPSSIAPSARLESAMPCARSGPSSLGFFFAHLILHVVDGGCGALTVMPCSTPCRCDWFV